MKSTARICQLCTKNEIHFLCVCPIYEHLRFLLYSDVVESPSMTAEHKFILLVTKYQKMFVNLLLVPGKLGKLTFLPTDINLTTV